MDKSPDAFRTISEVADALETPAHVLRFWETRFPQIKPVKRAGGRRYYRPSDVALLTGIKRLLHEDGLTIRGVQKILREQGVRHVASLGGGAEAARGALDQPVDIIDDFVTDEAVETAAVLPFDRAPAQHDPAPLHAEATADSHGDLWPDADLPPPDDDGTLILGGQDAAPVDLAARAPMRDLFETPDAAGTDDATTLPPPVDPDEAMIAAVLQTASEDAPPVAAAPPRASEGWRSLPLAAGEEMPMAARLRALPRGALAPRSVEVAAWALRARDLTQRMRQDGQSPS